MNNTSQDILRRQLARNLVEIEELRGFIEDRYKSIEGLKKVKQDFETNNKELELAISILERNK